VEDFSTSQYTERTGGPPPPHLCHLPTGLPDYRPAMPPTCRPTRLLPAGPPGRHPTRPQSARPPSARPPPQQPPAHQLPPATRRLQHHQMQAPKLPRRCRQTGLDAKRVTPELLRQKFYCSWTGDFFFLFFNCLSCSLFDCPPSLPVNFFGTPFFFSLFLFLFLFFLLSWFC
jgi:hypothetical protein